MRIAVALLCLLVFSRCSAEKDETAPDSSKTTVQTGADVLVSSGFASLAGKRVGLIANQTSVQAGSHLVDLFQSAPEVELTAIFAPEHGFQGRVEAGQKVQSDSSQRIPVFSLYGETRSPSAEMLENIDVLVFDIQDVGARFYTYISTMGYAMQAAAQNDIEFVVLDRPNPLGGNLVEGLIREEDASSFVSLFPIPAVHGLTVAELARMIKGEQMLSGLESLKLTTIRMDGWERDMQWPDTNLPWIPTSPNIPNFLSALIYPGTCLLEATNINEGRGTDKPFMVFGSPDMDPVAIVSQLNNSRLPGVRFDTLTYTPISIPGVAASPRHMDTELIGVEIKITNRAILNPHATGVHILTAIRDHSHNNDFVETVNSRWLKLLSGSDSILNGLASDFNADQITAAWEDDVDTFRALREQYLLYDAN
jgi:uncharacterized protein YbbC (DUF1343 family)